MEPRPERTATKVAQKLHPERTNYENICIAFDSVLLPQLKRHLAEWFPEMVPSHSAEFAARGLGYRTYASLLAALNEGPLVIDSVYAERAIDFARQVEFEVDARDVRQAFAELFDLGNPV